MKEFVTSFTPLDCTCAKAHRWEPSMTFIPKSQEIYRHFKGNLYQIVTVAVHTETEEELVIYQALYGDFKIYARPLSMFTQRVDQIKYKDSKQEYRFELFRREEEPIKVNIEEAQAEESNLDPMVIAFLDADSYEERLNILVGLQHRITHEMITTMAVVSDVEIPDGELEDRFQGLKNCLITLEKYECNRLR